MDNGFKDIFMEYLRLKKIGWMPKKKKTKKKTHQHNYQIDQNDHSYCVIIDITC